MNGWFQNWWLARGTSARGLGKILLAVIAVVGLLLFTSFNLHGESSVAKGSKTRITVGQPGPWLVWEKLGAPGMTTNAVGRVTSTSQRAESYVSVFTFSFAAGMLAIYSLSLLSRVSRIEKKERQEKSR